MISLPAGSPGGSRTSIGRLALREGMGIPEGSRTFELGFPSTMWTSPTTGVLGLPQGILDAPPRTCPTTVANLVRSELSLDQFWTFRVGTVFDLRPGSTIADRAEDERGRRGDPSYEKQNPPMAESDRIMIGIAAGQEVDV